MTRLATPATAAHVLATALLACAPVDRDPAAVAGAERPLLPQPAHGVASGVVFLPPMMQAPALLPPSVPGLEPVVRIVELDGASGEAIRTLVTFTTAAGEGSETIRETEAVYAVDWHTADLELDTAHDYRIEVLLGGEPMGHADVRVVDGGRELRNLDDQEAVALVDGRTLPIRFVLNPCMPAACEAIDRCAEVVSCQCDADGRACAMGLTADTTLSSSLLIDAASRIASLDCADHALAPRAGGIDQDPVAGTAFVDSDPPVAVVLDGTSGARVAHCRIEGFDFGVIVARAKAAGVVDTIDDDPPPPRREPGNRVVANHITVRTAGVYLLQADDVLVEDNTIDYGSERGRGIAVEFDSDRNEIRHNVVRSTRRHATGQVRRYPGRFGPLEAAVLDNGVQVVASNGPTLYNLLVNDRLLQVGTGTFTPSILDLDWFAPNHTFIHHNDLVEADGAPTTARVVNAGFGAVQLNARAQSTRVEDNAIAGPWTVGVSSGGQAASFLLPAARLGVCAGDPSRLCRGLADCTLAGLPDAGACTGVGSALENAKSHRTSIARNQVLGGVLGGIHLGQVIEATVEDNAIEAPGVERGINLVNDALGSPAGATVRRNVVDGASHALFLNASAAISTFGARVSRNDFVRSGAAAVGLSAGYAMPSELSVDLEGNFWGLDCAAPAYGFDGSQLVAGGNASVTDSHAFGESVATASGALQPCARED